MKKTISLFLLAAVVIFQSCGGIGGSKHKIGTKDGAEFASKKIKESLKGDEDILRMSVRGQEDGSTIQLLDIYYADATLKDEVRYNQINLVGGFIPVDKKPLSFAMAKASLNDKVEGNAKKFADFDFSKMPTHIEEGKKMIPKGFSYFGIQDYDLYGSKDLPYKFTINCTKDGEKKERSGQMIVTNYYQFEFEVDGKGKITLLEE
jgi:hypothetical protein